jgi:hypothetical protein
MTDKQKKRGIFSAKIKFNLDGVLLEFFYIAEDG